MSGDIDTWRQRPSRVQRLFAWFGATVPEPESPAAVPPFEDVIRSRAFVPFSARTAAIAPTKADRDGPCRVYLSD